MSGGVVYFPVDVVSEMERRFGLQVLLAGSAKGRKFDGLLVYATRPRRGF